MRADSGQTAQSRQSLAVFDPYRMTPLTMVVPMATKTWFTLVAIAASPATHPSAIKPTAIAYSVMLWPSLRDNADFAVTYRLRMRSCIVDPPVLDASVRREFCRMSTQHHSPGTYY